MESASNLGGGGGGAGGGNSLLINASLVHRARKRAARAITIARMYKCVDSGR